MLSIVACSLLSPGDLLLNLGRSSLCLPSVVGSAKLSFSSWTTLQCTLEEAMMVSGKNMPSHLILLLLTCATISGSVYKVLNSLFFRILHLPFSCMGPKIFLKICSQKWSTGFLFLWLRSKFLLNITKLVKVWSYKPLIL